MCNIGVAVIQAAQGCGRGHLPTPRTASRIRRLRLRRRRRRRRRRRVAAASNLRGGMPEKWRGTWREKYLIIGGYFSSLLFFLRSPPPSYEALAVSSSPKSPSYELSETAWPGLGPVTRTQHKNTTVLNLDLKRIASHKTDNVTSEIHR